MFTIWRPWGQRVDSWDVAGALHCCVPPAASRAGLRAQRCIQNELWSHADFKQPLVGSLERHSFIWAAVCAAQSLEAKKFRIYFSLKNWGLLTLNITHSASLHQKFCWSRIIFVGCRVARNENLASLAQIQPRVTEHSDRNSKALWRKPDTAHHVHKEPQETKTTSRKGDPGCDVAFGIITYLFFFSTWNLLALDVS